MKRIDFFAEQGARMAHSYSYATTSNAAMRKKMLFHVSIFMSQGTSHEPLSLPIELVQGDIFRPLRLK